MTLLAIALRIPSVELPDAELVHAALPVALFVDGAPLAAFGWAARHDQLEDLDTPPKRAIFDDVARKDRPQQGGGS